MSERVRTFAPGEEVTISLGFEYEGDGEIESVEAVFVREGSDAEIVLLGDARKEASGDRSASYAARLGARIAPNADPGEYRCVRISAHDQLDDDWDFTDIARLDLTVRVERTPRRLEVTTSEFL
ncbi:MAG: hypothetical protein M3N18_12055 [Actinomycetota bacterium]|nr:hypothetical protein [Actinomycetota bacterium]